MSAGVAVALPHVLDFDVVSYNGYSATPGPVNEGNEDDYPINNILDADAEKYHCSKIGNNFDLVLKYKPKSTTGSSTDNNNNTADKGLFTLTHFVVRGPPFCTAPVRTGIIFLHNEQPDIQSYTKKYDSISRQDYEAFPASTREQDGAVAYFTVTDEETLELASELPTWGKPASFVHIKFISCWGQKDKGQVVVEEDEEEEADEELESNIDIERLALIGYDAAETPAETVALGPDVPANLGVAKQVLGAWNRLHQDHISVVRSSPILICFSNDPTTANSQQANVILRGLATGDAYSDHLIFFYHDARQPHPKFANVIADHVGVPVIESQPAEMVKIVIAYLDNNVKYLYGGELTEEGIKAWIDQYIAGTLTPSRKSAARPVNDTDPDHPHVTILTGESFEELVLDANKDVFVDAWASWCQPLVFAPVITAVSDILADVVPHLRIGKFDIDANDPDPKYLPEQSIPILKLFPKADKAHPITYDGPPLAKDLLTFFHQHISEPKFDLSAALSQCESIDAIQTTKLQCRKRLASLKHLFEHAGQYVTQQDITQVLDAARALDELEEKKDVTVSALEAGIQVFDEAIKPLKHIDDLLQEAQKIAKTVMEALRSSVLVASERTDLQNKIEDMAKLMAPDEEEEEDEDEDEEEEEEEEDEEEEGDKENEEASAPAAEKRNGVDEDKPGKATKKMKAKSSSAWSEKKLKEAIKHLQESYATVADKVSADAAAKDAAAMGNVIKIHSQEEFDEQLSSQADRVVVIDFTASWCSGKKIKPIFGALSQLYANVLFLSVDVDEMEEIAAKYSISAMPTFVFLKNGEEIEDKRIQGADERELTTTIKELADDSSAEATGGGPAEAEKAAEEAAVVEEVE